MIRTSRPGWHGVSWVLSSRLPPLTHRLGSEIATSIVPSTFPALRSALRCFLFDPEASNWDCPSSSSSPFLMPGCWLGRLPPRSSRSSPPPPCSLSKHIEASPWTLAPHPIKRGLRSQTHLHIKVHCEESHHLATPLWGAWFRLPMTTQCLCSLLLGQKIRVLPSDVPDDFTMLRKFEGCEYPIYWRPQDWRLVVNSEYINYIYWRPKYIPII